MLFVLANLLFFRPLPCLSPSVAFRVSRPVLIHSTALPWLSRSFSSFEVSSIRPGSYFLTRIFAGYCRIFFYASLKPAFTCNFSYAAYLMLLSVRLSPSCVARVSVFRHSVRYRLSSSPLHRAADVAGVSLVFGTVFCRIAFSCLRHAPALVVALLV